MATGCTQVRVYSWCSAGSAEKSLERVAKPQVGLGPRNFRVTMESTYFEKTQK